ncbi:glycosyltransferase [Bradyrhizobium ottawaense]|uniref:glycosyltransferase n=1 Tax=Bradyrhizobium ottawaense TaxID=931866 RepID=UPI002012E41A|nr:glycosyltransferase [Bradyrhizobium ottawaense]
MIARSTTRNARGRTGVQPVAAHEASVRTSGTPSAAPLNGLPTLALLVPTITRAGGGVSEAVRLLHDAVIAEGRWTVEVHTIIAPGFDEARAAYGATPVYGARRRDRTRYGFSPGLVKRLLISDAQVLHVHGLWGFHCLAAYLWHLKTGRPYVVTPHGMLERWIMQRSRLLKTAISIAYQRRFLRRAASIHVLTGKERSDVNDVVPNLPMTVVPNFVVAPENVVGLGRPSWWRKDLGGRTVFLFFGRIHAKKGCMELCDAWERRCTSDPTFAANTALVFCGWTDGLDALTPRIASLAERFGNVIHAGAQFGDDKWRSLAAASFMILPSKSEGLPLAVLESWAVGVPTVMTRECNLPEGFAAKAALAIKPDVGDIERGLGSAYALTDIERAEMIAAAQELTKSTFSRGSVGTRMIALYEAARAG